MRFLRYLYGSINLLNILLFAGLLFLLLFVVLPLFPMKVNYTLPPVKIKPVTEEQLPGENSQPSSPADYVTVAENNLFHPERRMPPETKNGQTLLKPELVLYGTVVTKELSFAYVEDKKSPQTTPGRGERQTVVKKGDVLSGFIVKEIEKDRIVLTRGDETMVVELAAEGKQRGDRATGASSQTRPSAAPTTATTPQAASIPSGANPFAQPMPAPAQAPGVQMPIQTQRNPVRGPRGAIPPATDQTR